MPQLRIQYRIQVFCGYEAEEGVAKGVTTKSENTNVMITDAESENIAIIQKVSENVIIVQKVSEKVVIGKGNVAIESESIETKKNALKKNVSAVKCPEQTLYILQDRNLQYRLRHSFWL